MKMSEENFQQFSAILMRPNPTVGFVATVVLIETYDTSAFDLSGQLCSPASHLNRPYACPYQGGPSVSSGRYINLEVNCQGVAEAAVSYTQNGGISINGDDPNKINSVDCRVTHLLGTGAEPHKSDYQPSVNGIQCYFDGWDRPEGKLFKQAMSAGHLDCQYINHSYHLGTQELLATDDGLPLGAITVVIGNPPSMRD
jgi:hypothetical protein